MTYILDTNAAETNKVFGKTNTFLLNSILALFHRGYLGNYDSDFVKQTKDTLELITDPGITYESSITRANEILTDIIYELCALSEVPTVEWLEVRLKPLKVDHFEFINLIVDEFKNISEMGDEKIRIKYRIYRSLCDNYKEGFLIKSVAREMFGSVLNGDELTAVESMQSAIEKITPLVSRAAKDGPLSIPGISEYVMSNDKDAMVAEFKEAAQVVDARSVLKCGIQGWDRGMSDYGGMIRGAVMELQAISGGSKSDTARRYLTGVAEFTKPYMFDKTKKPALVYLTLEDTIARSLSRTLTQLRREKVGYFDVEDIPEEDAFELYRETVEKNGYTVFNIKGRQKELTPKNLLAVLQSIMDDGYEIHLFVADYMGLLSFADIDEANNSECIKTGYSYVFNFCQENKISAILCAQIAGREYQKVIDSAENDGLRELVHSNLSSQSMNIINVLDMRVMVNTVKGPTRAFHQIAFGKGRFSTALSEKDKYAVYELHRAVDRRDGVEKPAGFIVPDHDGPCRALARTPQVGMGEESLDIGF